MDATILTFPDIAAPASFDLSLKRFDASFTSPLSGAVQQILRPGALTNASLSWKVLSYADSQLLQAWCAQMASANMRTFILHHAYTAQGSLLGSPAVSGSGQTGTSLTTSGWTDSKTNVLMAGDFIQVCTGTITFTDAPAASDAITYIDMQGNSHSLGTGDGSTKTFNITPWFDTGCTVKVDGTATTAFTTSGVRHQTLQVTANVSSDASGDATVPVVPELRFSPTDTVAINTDTIGWYMFFSKPSAATSYTAPRIAALSISLTEDIQI